MSHREQHHAALHSFFATWYNPYDIPKTRIHPKRLCLSSKKKRSKQKYRASINQKIRNQSEHEFDICKYWFLSFIDTPEYLIAITEQKDNDFAYAVVQDCINEGLVNSSYVYNISQDEIKIIHNKNAINSAGKKWIKEHTHLTKIYIK